MEWQPIETAPKVHGHGDMLLLLDAGHAEDYHSRVATGFWGDRFAGMNDDGREEMTWCNWHEGFDEEGNWHTLNPTHWMPLPQPPHL